MFDDLMKLLEFHDTISLHLCIRDEPLRLLHALGLLQRDLSLPIDLIAQILLLTDVGLQALQNDFRKKRDQVSIAVETFDNTRFLSLQFPRLAFKPRQSPDLYAMQLLMHRENSSLIFPIHRPYPDKSQAPNADVNAVKKSSAIT